MIHAERPPQPRPVCFLIRGTIASTPRQVADGILDLNNWPKFTGYGPLPGIRSAEFETRTEGVVGTRITVINTDGSRHVEEILEWDPPRTLRLRLGEFSAPLCRLAEHFIEVWRFEAGPDGGTRVAREFELYPRSAWTRPALQLIRPLLRGAVRKHLATIDDVHAGIG